MPKGYEITYSILLILFLLFSVIILLSLLVAILSNTYNQIMERTNMEYANILYQSYQDYKFHKYYGALLLFPPPV